MLQKTSIRYSISPQMNAYTKKVKNYSFQLDELLGRGYNSQVYRAINEITRQNVAIKIIQFKSLRDAITRKMLKIQLECLNKICHPHLLRFIESFQTPNNCYIVTQLCEGSDLEKHLRRKGKLSEKQVMEIFWQIYQGYQHLYNVGYLHRDLKPANIFLKNNTIKIADFGFAKKRYENPQEYYNVGTTAYMSPQSLHANIYTEKTDIWSLGVICFELIHGRIPWIHQSQVELKHQISSVTPLINKSLVSAELQDFILNCLTLNPIGRMNLQQMWDHPWMIKVKELMNYSRLVYDRIRPLKSEPKVFGHNRIMSYNLPTQNNDKKIDYSLQKFTGCPLRLSTQPKSNKQNGDYYLNNQRLSFPLNQIKDESRQLQKQENRKDKKKQKQVIQSLILILNFQRFQYKVFEFLKKNQKIERKTQIKKMLITKLINSFQMQEQLVKTKLNIYNIPNWQYFPQASWEVYTKVISEYSVKYRKAYTQTILEQPFIHQSFQEFLYEYISETINKYQTDDILQSINLECISYLLTINKIQKLILKSGWQGYLNSYKDFVDDISKKKVINQSNSREILSNIRLQLDDLKCQ